MKHLTLAIDPGRSGGIAIRYPEGQVEAKPIPDTDADILEALRQIAMTARHEGWSIAAWVEKVGGYVGGAGQPGAAMFTFGQSYGFILGALMALEIPLSLVRPQQWQAALHLGKSRSHSSKPAWKRHLRDEATRRFPHLRPTLSTADALLILAAAPLLLAPLPAPCGAESAAGPSPQIAADQATKLI